MLSRRFALSGLTASLLAALLQNAQAQVVVGLRITVAPPILPTYVQPPLPAIGYIWTPGYWAYGDAGYYWVPGVWVQPPSVGVLWTPGYWGWNDGVYVFNHGYWGPHVGFYGGVNYGYGYTGFGFAGGEWRGGAFAYNSAYNNFGGTHVTNVYNHTVVVNNSNRYSFNGPGGVAARPTEQEQSFSHEQHVEATADQQRHFAAAAAEPSLRASANGGRPPIAAVTRPGEFHGAGVVAARTNAGAERPNTQRAAPARSTAAPRAQVPRAQAPRAQAPHPQAQRAQAPRAEAAPRAAARPAARPAGRPEEHKG
jgi:hypothetical protein